MFVLDLTGNCNNNCMFCYIEKEFYLDTEKAKSLISKARERGEKHINFFGGEPTIHPNFFGLARYVKDQGLDFSLNSNLRLLSYREVAKRVMGFDPVLIQTSLHGHKPEVHDELTMTTGSFEQTVKGIKNLLELGYNPKRIIINTVITRQNLKYLKDIADFVLDDLKLPKTKFSFVEIEGNALKNIKELVPRFKEIYPFLERAVKHAKDLGKTIIVEKGPLCFCPDISNVSYIFEKVLIDTNKFIKPQSCSPCPSNEKCHGIHRNYIRLYPSDKMEKKEIHRLKVVFRN